MQDLVEKLSSLLADKGLRFTCAESCTGGMLAAAITDRPGSSQIFERGFVTYSNEAKSELLGVSPGIIESHGAVSEETALAMAEGALKNSHADLALSVTGIAGPEGGSEEKPVGLVCFGYALKGELPGTKQHVFTGDRAVIRSQAVEMALKIAIDVLEKAP